MIGPQTKVQIEVPATAVAERPRRRRGQPAHAGRRAVRPAGAAADHRSRSTAPSRCTSPSRPRRSSSSPPGCGCCAACSGGPPLRPPPDEPADAAPTGAGPSIAAETEHTARPTARATCSGLDDRPDVEEAGGGSAALVRNSAVMAAGHDRLAGARLRPQRRDRRRARDGADRVDVHGRQHRPNIIYILLAGGVLNAVFVPQLVRAMKEGAERSRAYTDGLLTLAGGAAARHHRRRDAGRTLGRRGLHQRLARAGRPHRGDAVRVLVPAADLLLRPLHDARPGAHRARQLRADDVGADRQQRRRDRHRAGVHRPVHRRPTTTRRRCRPRAIAFLGAGTTLGVALQALVLVPVLRRTGFGWRPRFDLRGLGLRRAGDLARWTFLFVLVNQLAYLVIVNLGVRAGRRRQGSARLRGRLRRLRQRLPRSSCCPHSIITVSVVTGLLPQLSRDAADGRAEAVRDQLSWAWRLTAVAVVPAAAALVALGTDVTGVAVLGRRSHPTRALHRAGRSPRSPSACPPSPRSTSRCAASTPTRTPARPFLLQVGIAATNVLLALAAYSVLPLRLKMVGRGGGLRPHLRRWAGAVDGGAAPAGGRPRRPDRGAHLRPAGHRRDRRRRARPGRCPGWSAGGWATARAARPPPSPRAGSSCSRCTSLGARLLRVRELDALLAAARARVRR